MTMISPKVERARSKRGAADGDVGGASSVLKALKLLEVFGDGESALGVTEIARRVEVPTSTAYRLLAYLVEGGFVIKDGPKYHLGGRLFALGNQVSLCRPKGLREQVSPHLGELYSATGLTAKLGILEGSEVVILDKVVGLKTVPAPTAIGGRLPANCTSMGKALLAFAEDTSFLDAHLPRLTRFSINSRDLLQRQFREIRETRLSYGAEEAAIGQVCVASPIVRDGHAVAAISLSSRPNDPHLSRSIGALDRAARHLERSLKL